MQFRSIQAEKLFTNVYDDDDFSEAGDLLHLKVPSLNLTVWNEYEIRWLPDRVKLPTPWVPYWQKSGRGSSGLGLLHLTIRDRFPFAMTPL